MYKTNILTHTVCKAETGTDVESEDLDFLQAR